MIVVNLVNPRVAIPEQSATIMETEVAARTEPRPAGCGASGPEAPGQV